MLLTVPSQITDKFCSKLIHGTPGPVSIFGRAKDEIELLRDAKDVLLPTAATYYFCERFSDSLVRDSAGKRETSSCFTRVHFVSVI